MERHLGGSECLFGKLMWMCAPERKQQLQALLSEMGEVSFFTDDTENRVLFKASASGRKITVGLRCLGRLWANCYSYFVCFTEIASVLGRDPSRREFDLSSTPRFRQAKEVLEWATNNDLEIKISEQGRLKPNLTPYPQHLPHPLSSANRKSDEDAADNIFYMALGFILHHELAHIRLRHSDLGDEIETAIEQGDDTRAAELSAYSIAQENEADMAATEWLLGEVDANSDQFAYKIPGTALGLAWLTSLAHDGFRGGASN